MCQYLYLYESKLSSSFLKTEFQIEGYTEPCRFDRNCNGWGISIYLRSDIPSKEI